MKDIFLRFILCLIVVFVYMCFSIGFCLALDYALDLLGVKEWENIYFERYVIAAYTITTSLFTIRYFLTTNKDKK